MRKRIVICLVCVLSLFSFSAFIIDDDPITMLLKKLEEFTKKFPQEKVYLHLDKPYYAIGDDIWFKAYVINAKTNEPTDVSNVLYVELINEKDSVSKKLRLPMASGIAWGDFKLSDSLSEGNYRIRAYTQWMRNAGPEFFFDKTIKIGNSWANVVTTKTSVLYSAETVTNTIQFVSKSNIPYLNCEVNYTVQLAGKNISKGKANTNANGEIKIITQNTTNQNGRILATITLPDQRKISKTILIKSNAQPDVQFFPEGGSLVEGLPSKIAIKVINKNGLGENVTATISDNDGLEILSFETPYLGMGSFSLTPMERKSYKAKVKFSNGTEQTYNLPKAEKSGYVLAINNLDTTKMLIKIMLSPDLLNKGDLNLVAQHNGNIYLATKVSTVKQISTVVLPKSETPSGIIQLTLFNASQIPVAERIAFINSSNDKIDLTIQNLKTSYGKKANVSLDLNATNHAKPIQGSFSVTVTNTDIVAQDIDNESNILTGLLLTSDLVGYIERPNHYFLKNDLQTRIELDNLLLTQGWRKINWKELTNTQKSTYSYPIEKYLSISGTITKSSKPIPNGKISLYSNSKNGLYVLDTLSDATGNFNFDRISFKDSTKFVIQAKNEKGKDVKIKINNIPEQLIGINTNTGDIDINVNATLANYLSKSNSYFDEQYKNGFLNRTNTLKEVNITTQKILAPNSSNLNGPGKADKVITEKDLENVFSLAQYFKQGRVMGVSVNDDGMPVSTRPTGSDTPQTMTVSMDGMVIHDFSLENVEVTEVESIEVLKGPAFTGIYGADGYYGVLVITTKRGQGKKASDINSPGLVIHSPKGYDIARQFYSPKYNATPDPKPDFRSTVYWNPHLVTDVSGKADLNYFNTDQPGTYRILIEGIDAEGNLARKVVTYQVK